MRGGLGADRLLGAVGGAMVLAALLLLLFGGEGDTGVTAEAEAVPALTLLAPAGGDTVGSPLELRFQTEADLSARAGGWGTGTLHLHLRLDDGEYMPGPADLRREPSGGYRWVVPGVAPGDHTVQLYWSDLQHRPLRDGATPTVRLRVE